MPGEYCTCLVQGKVQQQHTATIFPAKIFFIASLVLTSQLPSGLCLWMPNIPPCLQWITGILGRQSFKVRLSVLWGFAGIA